MRLVTSCLVLVILSSNALFSQPDLVAKFGAGSYTFQSQVLPYRIFIPDNYQPSVRYPLVLCLHGSGESGTDNIAQLQANKMATAWVDSPVQAKNPCFVIAPQCPSADSWGGEIAALNGLLDSLSREFSIDSNQIYITGLSMGGYGTWQMITTYPHRFAAAVPMSGGWDSSMAYLAKDMPIWDFHGDIDPTVPVSESRKMITALENLGRMAVYTNCHAYDCTGLPDSLVAMYVRSHADLFYTEYQGGGHVIWDQAYTTPLLSTWLFDKYRQTPSVIRLTNLTSHRSLTGMESIAWTGGSTGDSVEIWESPDAGGHWQLVIQAAPNTGSYEWNTASVPDCAFGLLKIFLKNTQGRIYGHDQSSFFTINNPGNGIPFVRVTTPGVPPGQMLTADSLALQLLAADPEDATLSVRILYSSNEGDTFVTADSFAVPFDTVAILRRIDIGQLANSENALIAVEASDGSLVGKATLPMFAKLTPRVQGPPAEHTAGGGGSVTVHVIDPAQLTGHLYQVTFQGTTYGMKTYDVTDMDRGVMVVNGGFPLDGRTEGPLFDGVRLLVRDVELAGLDTAGTKWEVSAPTIMNVVVSLPTIDLGGEIIYGYPQPADYAVDFADHVVDTSSSAVAGVPEVPVKFSVTNLTENRRSKFIYVDADNSGTFSGNDEVYILEPDSISNLRVTWELQFLAHTGTTLPQPGDRFVLRTVKPISMQDIYEFRTVSTSVEETSLPERPQLYANYPNPFNPATMIRFTVSGVVPVKLVVYDILGRKVVTLVDERKAPGTYQVLFDGSDLASGVYFYRLSAGAYVETRKMVLLK
jgi:poly(3-hydroxybutyrate) depolymerase